MFKSSCLRRGVAIIYLLVLLYFCVMVPFISRQEFYENYDYIVATTIGGVIFTLTSILMNDFAFYVLTFGSSVKEPNNYLFALITIFDLLLPILYYPIRISDLWIYKNKLYRNMNYNSFMAATVQLAAAHMGVATASVITFTFICLLRFYHVFQKYGLGGIKISLKVIFSVILIVTAVVVGLIDYHFIREQWFYAFQTSICMFFPLFLMATCLLAALLRAVDTVVHLEHDASLLLHLRLVRKTALQSGHREYVPLEDLPQHRCLVCFFDDEFRRTSQNTLNSLRWGRKKVTFTKTVNDEDIAIRYSPNHNSVSLGIDDEQALINT